MITCKCHAGILIYWEIKVALDRNTCKTYMYFKLIYNTSIATSSI